MRRAVIITAILGFLGTPALAQPDPRPSLLSILTAFQMCGPPMAYQALSPSLWQIVAQQTNGSGCYLPIAQAGPILKMDVLDSQMFPLGPLYAVRVTHAAGPVDWFIGFNSVTGKVEYLSFQSIGPLKPSIEGGADSSRTMGGVEPPSPPKEKEKEKEKGNENGDEDNDAATIPVLKTAAEKACERWPRMCP